MRTVRCGIIGAGMMGREFAGATTRWCQVLDTQVRPELAALCTRTLSPERIGWFRQHFPGIDQYTADYRELLAREDIDAVYVAVPHDRHAEIYRAVLAAGKHLLGEKPFGIDLAANEAILAAVAGSDRVVGCASQFVFCPGVQRILRMAAAGAFGRIIEAEGFFLHSSDLNPTKPGNWKRQTATNGAYGVLGDLGVHSAFLPARLGWQARNVRAICTDIISVRPTRAGGTMGCDTWDNATLLVEMSDPATGAVFPWTLRAARIMPGEMNTWGLAIHGTTACARFSLKNPRRLELLEYPRPGAEQVWQQIDIGYETAYPTTIGPLFEFGEPDAFLQLLAAWLYQIEHGRPLSGAAACPTPAEMHFCHRLFTAALQSQADAATVAVDGG